MRQRQDHTHFFLSTSFQNQKKKMMGTQTKIDCTMIAIVCAVFLYFYGSSIGMATSRTLTACSARLTKKSNDSVSSRKVTTTAYPEEKETTLEEEGEVEEAPLYQFGEVSEGFQKQFDKVKHKGKTPADIQKLYAKVKPEVSTEVNPARFVGTKLMIPGQCYEEKERDKKPSFNTMLTLPSSLDIM